MPMVTDHLTHHVKVGQESLLFHDRSGRNRRPSEVQPAWHVARAMAGRDDLKFHHLRDTGAVLATQSGATLADLMGRLGHTTQAMAMIYQHTAADRDRLIVDRLSQVAMAATGGSSRVASPRTKGPGRPSSASGLEQPSLLDA